MSYSVIQKNGYTFASVYTSKCVTVFFNQTLPFDPIKISTCWALQNDRQNLSFVKDTNGVGEKMARNTCKMAISYLCHFRFETKFRLVGYKNSISSNISLRYLLKKDNYSKTYNMYLKTKLFVLTLLH